MNADRGEDETMKRPWTVPNHAATVNKGIKLIQEELAGGITLYSVAKHIGISVAHFSRIFKQQTGMTFSAFLSREKERTTKRLLRNRSLQIKQVANLSGYRNPDYFSRKFKKLHGKTASELRNSMISKHKSI